MGFPVFRGRTGFVFVKGNPILAEETGEILVAAAQVLGPAFGFDFGGFGVLRFQFRIEPLLLRMTLLGLKLDDRCVSQCVDGAGIQLSQGILTTLLPLLNLSVETGTLGLGLGKLLFKLDKFGLNFTCLPICVSA